MGNESDGPAIPHPTSPTDPVPRPLRAVSTGLPILQPPRPPRMLPPPRAAARPPVCPHPLLPPASLHGAHSRCSPAVSQAVEVLNGSSWNSTSRALRPAQQSLSFALAFSVESGAVQPSSTRRGLQERFETSAADVTEMARLRFVSWLLEGYPPEKIKTKGVGVWGFT
eukprot:gnl/TRDRNA2_/TRDRNA2_170317_c0_seq4.p1 gnl/TRDRNA2_/TRDRNA2_170317_c0~~gnl/TRDRNA2_/TRDRNA2_170317_c0_seq4.p1  ORF type:complete len:168 (-),score=1.18 gnl/TRDRNA2_/TRDRNA2_170317_c0_seq4:8-511(-)